MNAYEIWQSLIFFKESFMLIALILNKKCCRIDIFFDYKTSLCFWTNLNEFLFISIISTPVVHSFDSFLFMKFIIVFEHIC